MSFDLAAQRGIIDNLKASAGLSALVGTRIYDFVPQKPTFPFVNIGEDALTEFDTSSHDGAMVEATIHTWSNAKGKRETKEIQGAIRNSLHKATLTFSGFTIVFCHWLNSQSFLDADGTTRHGVCIYNLYIRED